MKSSVCSSPPTETAKGHSRQALKPEFLHIKHKIDSLLAKDIELLKKDMPHKSSNNDLQLQRHNNLLLEYVDNNYLEYNLRDPLPSRPIKLRHRRNITVETPQKLEQVELTTQLRNTQEVQSLKSDIYSHSNHPRQLKTEPDEHRKTTENSKNKSATQTHNHYTSNQKTVILLKKSKAHQRVAIGPFATNDAKRQYLTSQFSEKDASVLFEGVELHESQVVNMVNKKSPNKIEQSKIDIGINTEGKCVEESYRFCIGCEQPVLQVNIPHHERSCQQFQIIISKQLQDIVPLIQAKIAGFKNILRNRLQPKKQTSLKKTDLPQEAVGMLKRQVQAQLLSKQLDLNQNVLRGHLQSSIDTLDALAKMKWFTRIYVRMKEIIRKQKHIKKII